MEEDRGLSGHRRRRYGAALLPPAEAVSAKDGSRLLGKLSAWLRGLREGGREEPRWAGHGVGSLLPAVISAVERAAVRA